MLRPHKCGLPLRATLLIVVAAVLWGCGRGGGPILHSASDPLLRVTPSKIDFWGVRVGNKASKSVTLTNSGTGTLTISQATLMGSHFSLSGLSLPLSLSAGQSLSFSVVFAPVAGGPASGSLSLTSNASTPPPPVGLSGMGAIYQLTAGASSLNFGNVALTSTSTKTVSFTNTGTVTLNISQISAAPAGFSVKGPNLSAILEPGQSSGVSVTFSPAATGAASGSLSVVSDASASPATVALEGTGVTYQLGVSPGSLNFETVTVASTTTQTLTLSNTGTASLIISQASVTGTGFSLSGLSLPLTLAPGQSAPVIVTFAPSAASTAAGAVSILSSASASPVTIALSGLGATFSSLQASAASASATSRWL
jgi:archaellum component FlaF (FlaF/FlaG flagellin family)